MNGFCYRCGSDTREMVHVANGIMCKPCAEKSHSVAVSGWEPRLALFA